MKGPAVRPLGTSSAKFKVTTLGLREAVGKFFEKTKLCRTGVADPSPFPQLKVQLINKFPVGVVLESTV